MSLAEHLAAEAAVKPDCVICTWLATLSAEDRTAFHGFHSTIAAGNATIAQLWRACARSGFTGKYKRFADNYRKDCHVAY